MSVTFGLSSSRAIFGLVHFFNLPSSPSFLRSGAVVLFTAISRWFISSHLGVFSSFLCLLVFSFNFYCQDFPSFLPSQRFRTLSDLCSSFVCSWIVLFRLSTCSDLFYWPDVWPLPSAPTPSPSSILRACSIQVAISFGYFGKCWQ